MPSISSSSRLASFTCGLFLVTLLAWILYVAQNILLPLVVALVFWYIIIMVSRLFARLAAYASLSLPQWLSLTIATLITGCVLYLFLLLITQSVTHIVQQSSQFQDKIQALLQTVNQHLHTPVNLRAVLAKLNFPHLISIITHLVSNLTSHTVLILVYLLFLLLEYNSFSRKLEGFCDTPSQYKKAQTVLEDIDHDIALYIKLKTGLNAIAAVTSYLVMTAFGLDGSAFWALLIFLFSYIPFIGPIAAVLFILLATAITVTHWWAFFALAVLLIVIQFIVGNILEPRWMGTHLNLSPLVILLSLAVWGSLWGITGMFLSVPMMVMLTIILGHIPYTKKIAILLAS